MMTTTNPNTAFKTTDSLIKTATKHPHNPIADTSARNTHNAHTCSLWQRCLMAIALLVTCVLGVKAEKYVIYYQGGDGTKYYMANVNNTLTVLTVLPDENYDAKTCVWEGTSGGTFSNNGKNICFAASTGNEAIVSLDGTSRNLTIDNDGICYINQWYSFYLYYKNNSFYATNLAQLYGNTRVKAEVAEATPPTEPDDNLLVEAKNNAKNTLTSKTPGAAVCQYTYTINGQPVTEASLIETAIDNATTIEEVNTITASASINLPVVGKYYRIKGYVSKNYIDAVNRYNNSIQMGMKPSGEYSELGTVFYLDEGNRLLNLGTGTYVYETRAIGATKENANIWTFAESTRTPGCITLQSNATGGAGQHLHDNEGNRADRCSSDCGIRHDFVLEEVILDTPEPRFIISKDFRSVTLSCTENEGTIYYTEDGSDPTIAISNRKKLTVGQGITFSATSGLTVKAYAHKEGYGPSAVITQVMNISTIGTAEEFAAITGSGIYIITADITVTSHTSITNFTGVLDGGFHTISGLNAPLFASTDGAIIKNVTLKDVSISGTGSAGAIVGTASGATRIYNCGVLSGTISGSANVGSIAGELRGTARVINCYSYANITGGTTVGGIVGNNRVAYTTGSPKTLVMNCIFYGSLSGAADKYPIFGGYNITNNQGENTYNFFRYDENTTYAGYNAAQAVFKDEYLDRFGFYQRILNSHRELAAYYAFNDVNEADEIGKWALDKTRAPYPIVTKHLSNTQKTLKRTIPVTDKAYAGKKIKDIDVTININGKVYNEKLPVTDMDTARWDYTYGKIVLPFANEFTGWSIGDAEAITGWKVSTKDYYQDLNNVFNNENYVYAQGGNYIVPEGVTALTLTAYVAPAVYLSDASYDIVYNSSYGSPQGRGGATPTTYKGQKVYNTLYDALRALKLDSNSDLPHMQAIVLVGNFHYQQSLENSKKNEGDPGKLTQSTWSYFDNNKPFTLMSADKDNDQEPDYCFYQYHTVGSGRTMIHPVRFDFLAAPGIGMASHIEGAAAVPSIGIWHGKGWFELTETYLGIMQECEIRPGYFLVNSPWIINGGIFEEINMSSTHEYENPSSGKLTYIRIGGNAYINNFYPGTQSSSATFTTPLKPICMSGGEVVSCYMTGKQPEKSVTSGSVNFFCNGGYIHEFLGAYLEPLATNQDINVRVDHAIIDNFYGGGANENKTTPGNINITINNSQVGFFCGGPKFGNMVAGKKVTIKATGSTFGEFYGGGYGGTALTRKEVKGETIDFGGNDRTYGLSYENYYKDYRLKYDANLGIAVNNSQQYFMYAGGGGRGVEKFNVDYARLSLAAVMGNITSNLTDCTILNNFYGGGCQGSVTGNITSTLNNCKVGGSAFAAGYTANATPCLVATEEQPTYSKFVLSLGYFTPFGEVHTEEFYWKAADADHKVGSTDDANKTLYTTEEKFTNMGQVTGNTSIVVKGASEIAGSVFGGGNASKVIGNTHVHIQGGTIKGNVFGAGNQAEVTGKTEVVIGE